MWHSNPIIVVFDWRDVMIGALAEHVINPVDLEMPFFGQSVLSHHLSYGYVHETSVLPMFQNSSEDIVC